MHTSSQTRMIHSVHGQGQCSLPHGGVPQLHSGGQKITTPSMSSMSGGLEKQRSMDCFPAQMRAVLGNRNCIVGLLPLLSQNRKLTVLNAKCIYTCLLTNRELSASPFMQCCVLYCVDQNHFEYHCTCI